MRISSLLLLLLLLVLVVLLPPPPRLPSSPPALRGVVAAAAPAEGRMGMAVCRPDVCGWIVCYVMYVDHPIRDSKSTWGCFRPMKEAPQD